MTRQEIIEELQNDIQHNRIDEVELDRACEKYSLNIYDDLLAPIGYNLCDRCGDYGDSEQDLLWVDCYNWDDNSPTDQAILKAIAQEHTEYCALCRECVKELEKKGE